MCLGSVKFRNLKSARFLASPPPGLTMAQSSQQVVVSSGKSQKPSELQLTRFVTSNPTVLGMWKVVCRSLGMSDRDIDALSRDYTASGQEELFFQCLRHWLRQSATSATSSSPDRTSHRYKPATWESVLSALEDVGVRDLSQQIEADLMLNDPMSTKPEFITIVENVVRSESGMLRILKWESVCRNLGVESKDYESIKLDHPNRNVRAFQESLFVWYKGNTRVPVTWKSLFEALQAAGEKGLVRELMKKLNYEDDLPAGCMVPIPETGSQSVNEVLVREKKAMRDFIKGWMPRIKSEAEAKMCAQDLVHNFVISESVCTDIERAKTKREANGHLYQHLRNQATVDTMDKLFSVWAQYKGDEQPTRLVRDMKGDMEKCVIVD